MPVCGTEHLELTAKHALSNRVTMQSGRLVCLIAFASFWVLTPSLMLRQTAGFGKLPQSPLHWAPYSDTGGKSICLRRETDDENNTSGITKSLKTGVRILGKRSLKCVTSSASFRNL